MRRFFAALCLALLALAPARADTVVARIAAHPALWTVHGAKGTAYLLGSIHLLPTNVDWRSKEVAGALAKADTLVFEIDMKGDFQERIQQSVQARGMLPEGKHLHDLLSPEAKAELDAELKTTSLSPVVIDRMRPWLAALTLEMAEIRKDNYGVGVEMEIVASGDKRPTIALETVDQQLAMLVPDDPKTELQEFEASLKSSALEKDAGQMGPMVDAWTHGDTKALDRLTGAELDKYPQARKHLLDDRNRAWTEKLARLLAERKTYFVVVGAAHLVGPRGVPALLRAKGFKVDGP
ncbi:MAG TPA: TraB/GumN family protein [Rhizomicrobium sp.]|nr:TraB/GumN family protein [Rhizomicrobium sp.]